MGDLKRVLIAGGSGLIGRALAARLGATGYIVRAVGGSQNVDFPSDSVEYLRRDFLRPEALEGLFDGFGTVIFCAGRAGGRGQFKRHASEMALDACLMNANLLKACVKASVRRIILVASATMYPPREGPISEGDLDLNEDPSEAYHGLGWSWRYLERMARWLGKEHSMEVIILRTSNVFGPYGRFDPAYSNFIPALVRKAVANSDPFEVHGSPGVTRDVLFVENFADAIMKLMSKAELGIQAFNIGSGYATRVGEVVDWALNYADHQPSGGVVYSEPESNGGSSSYLDCRRLTDFIDWKTPASAEEGIAQLVDWWKENQNAWTR